MANEPMVFVVDDDSAVVESTVALFQAAGLPARAFGSAEEFLAAYQPDQIGVLLLDVRLPGMGGVELKRKLAADGSNLSVILISGHASADILSEEKAADELLVLEKPMDSLRLLKLVKESIRVRDVNASHERPHA